MKIQDKRIEIGTRFLKGGDKEKRVRTVIDIHTTYNHSGELIRVTYVSEHDFLGLQKIKVEDVPAATIIRGLLKPFDSTKKKNEKKQE